MGRFPIVRSPCVIPLRLRTRQPTIRVVDVMGLDLEGSALSVSFVTCKWGTDSGPTTMTRMFEVSQLSQRVATPCDTCFEVVTLGMAREKARGVARVLREMVKMKGSVQTYNNKKELALENSASPATLPEGLRHLRHLKKRQAIQRLARWKCRKAPCDSAATLATLQDPAITDLRQAGAP